MNKRLLVLMFVVVLAVSAFAVACGGDGTTETTAGGTATTAAPSGEPIKIGFDEGFTSFMAYDCELADKGVKTALAMLDNQYMGRPLEYFAEDNGSDPVVAVDKARKLVESDKINCHDRPDLLAVGEGRGRLPGRVVGHTADVHRRAADREPGDRQRVGLHPHRLLRFPRLLLRQVPGGAGLQDGQLHPLR